MSAKAIREYHGKRLVSKWISEYGDYDIENRCVQVARGCSFCINLSQILYVTNGFRQLVSTCFLLDGDTTGDHYAPPGA